MRPHATGFSGTSDSSPAKMRSLDSVRRQGAVPHSEPVEVIDDGGELDRLRADGQTFTAVAVGAGDPMVDARLDDHLGSLVAGRGEVRRFGDETLVVLLPRRSTTVAMAEQLADDIRRSCEVPVGVAHSHPSATGRDVVEAAARAMRVSGWSRAASVVARK